MEIITCEHAIMFNEGTAFNTKFMQTLDEKVYAQLEDLAQDRGVTIQEFLRAIVIPYYMKNTDDHEKPMPKARHREVSRHNAGT